MTIAFYEHLIFSYVQKAKTAFYEKGMLFEAKMIDGSEPVASEFAAIWLIQRFPVIVATASSCSRRPAPSNTSKRAVPRTLDTGAPDLHNSTAWSIWAGVTAPIFMSVFGFRRGRKIVRCGRAPAHSAAVIVRAWYQIPRDYSRFGLMTGRW